jgi:acetoin utilization protein AcuC
VYGPRSPTYDFGAGHPLTPRRFGPGIDLLRLVGAEPGLAPEPASDDDLLTCHTARYLAAVRRLGAHPDGQPEGGIAVGGDVPPFRGMHAAASSVGGGSLRAVEAILRGDVEHAYHPGGGLHHAMPGRASGFCVYNDPALAIARARRDGLRVLYVDLDVHHGDGVQAIHLDDPGVLTVSIHETGRSLFPGTGYADELGDGAAGGTSVNVPLEPFTGERAWLSAVSSIVPPLAAAFGPDLIVSQHGADTHVRDPLAHLRVTTTAMGRAARLIDAIAHRYAGGRWLATGGGGYDVYGAVPRAWALTWLAGAHREPPSAIPDAWIERWAPDAARFGQAPPPDRFDDEPNAGLTPDGAQREAEDESLARTAVLGTVVLPALLWTAVELGWWDPLDRSPLGAARAGAGEPPATDSNLVAALDIALLDRLDLAARTIPPADPVVGQAIVRAALASDRATAAAAVSGSTIVGLALAVRRPGPEPGWDLVALGVAPGHRRRGVARRVLGALVARLDGPIDARVGVAERDPVDPLDRRLRATIARGLLAGAGFEVREASGARGRIDPSSIIGSRA